VVAGSLKFIADDEHEMAAAVERLDEIEPARCRDLARERYDVAAVAASYERVYETVSSSRRSVTSSTDSVL